MNIDSLRYFHLIAKEGNISGVAKEIHLSQSALSQQIQKLENDMSKKLLIRSNKGVTLTNTGKIVYKFAENILRTYDKMMEEIVEADKGNLVIKIEACHSVADYALPCTLIKANGEYPTHNYELSSNLSGEIVPNVLNNICDVGFCCDPEVNINGEELVATNVGISSIVLISKNDDSFPDVISVERLLDACLITFTERSNITNMMLRNLKKMGYDQSSLFNNLRVEGIESAKMLVSKNYGIAFLPYISIKEELYKKQLKIIDIPDFDMDIDIYMLYKKDCPGHVRDFVEWFKKNGSKTFC